MKEPYATESSSATVFGMKTTLLAQGDKELSLCVTEGNASAQYLYKKLGFYVCDPS